MHKTLKIYKSRFEKDRDEIFATIIRSPHDPELRRNSTHVPNTRLSDYITKKIKTVQFVLTLHLVKTNLLSKSCTVSSGLPSPLGSIKPASTVISL